MHDKFRESLVLLSHIEDGSRPDIPLLCKKTSLDERAVKSRLNFLKKSGIIFDNGLVLKLQVKKIRCSQF